MTRTIEVESRYRIMGDIPKFSFPFSDERRIVDTYLDTKDGSFYQQGVFIRNRNNLKLDFKFNLESFLDQNLKSDHSHCDEYSFDMPFNKASAKDLKQVCSILKLKFPAKFTYKEFLKINSLSPLVVVDKKRYIAEDSGFELSIDVIKDVGNFIEIEKLVKVDTHSDKYQQVLDQTKQSIQKYVKSLGIKAERFETGYVELILQNTNFELYMKGKYLLNKDKKA